MPRTQQTIQIGQGRSDLLVRELVAQLDRCRDLLGFEQAACARALRGAADAGPALERFVNVRRNAERVLQLGEQARLRSHPVSSSLLAGVIGLQAAILEAQKQTTAFRRERAELAALSAA